MKLPFKTFLLCIVGAVALAAPANNGYAAPAHGQGWPLILSQPESQMVPDGAKVMFCVRAEGEPPNESIGLAYQWQTNMNFDLDHPDKGWIDIANATLATNEIAQAHFRDVGWYRVSVTDTNKNKPIFSEPASLLVFSGQGASKEKRKGKGKGKRPRGTLLTVFGPPVLSGSPPTSCPGDYVGYVNYKQPLPAWGWVPTNAHGSFTAQDGTTNPNTKTEMSGSSGDHPCSPTPLVQTNNLPSAKYRFTIYFTSRPGTNSYPITLTGFK